MPRRRSKSNNAALIGALIGIVAVLIVGLFKLAGALLSLLWKGTRATWNYFSATPQRRLAGLISLASIAVVGGLVLCVTSVISILSITPTPTATSTATATATPTFTRTPTVTNTASPSNTPGPLTLTATFG